MTPTVLNAKTAKWALDNVKKGNAIYAERRVAENGYKKGDETIYTTDIIANVIDRLAPTQRDDGE
jgi:single-strand DNA-binding protein